MSIGLKGADNSFFTVESDDIALTDRVISQDIKSITITEKMDGLPTGTLTFNDPSHIYSRIFRTGAPLKISWGYRDQDTSPDSLIEKQINFDEVTGSLVRRGLEVFVSSPSGGGSAGGEITYQCNFTAYGFRGGKDSRTFETGSKADVIKKVFDELGVSEGKSYINFQNGIDRLGSNRSVRQDETNYRFLTKLAREWRALFQISFTPDGQAAAVFIDPDKIGKIPWAFWTTGAQGKSHVLGYKDEISNVISYSWSSNEGESGVGESVQVEFVDGQPVFRRFVAEQETVISYRLIPERIQEAFDQTEGDFEDNIQLAQELLSAKDFEEVERFFEPIESTTAPSGYGYRIKAKMLGNPLYCPPNEIKINKGFPDRLGGDKSKYYLNTVTHTIDQSGYKMDVEVVDVFTLSPTGEPLL